MTGNSTSGSVYDPYQVGLLYEPSGTLNIREYSSGGYAGNSRS